VNYENVDHYSYGHFIDSFNVAQLGVYLGEND